MKEIIAFFKEIFMISDENSKVKIGLSQFKEEKEIVKPVKKIKKFEKEVKISDLTNESETVNKHNAFLCNNAALTNKA